VQRGEAEVQDVRLQEQESFDTPEPAGLEVRLATSAGEVRQALRLRYAVFGEELGARLSGAARGVDRDRFDPFCDHLVVCERAGGRVVGTYRILPPAQRRRAGGWYCANEFDVGGLECFGDRTVEIGRACVAPAYRRGHAISLLWAGLLRYVLERRCQYVIGCASIDTGDGGHIAASVCRRLLQHHLAPPDWRVVPRRAFVLEGWREIVDAPLPPLLKGYLRLGAKVCGEPAWDGDFDTADLLMMLPLAETNPRYVERLLRAA
jgi:putative hemolysin